MKAKWIVGEIDVDASWNDFQKQLETIGVKKAVEIYQAALDRYNRS